MKATNLITSKDGTSIAYEQTGRGPAVAAVIAWARRSSNSILVDILRR
jgi:hypothetical protein